MIENAFLAVGLVLIVEGLVYALAPSLVEQMLEALREMPIDSRRMLGLGALTVGLALVWAAKTLGA
ncbi:Putative inner membrane protein YjeT (clustered with HflC) [hydrothermal vent metagenome]|uniref:Inner membrane protein YjeT (Clustered with HflC) n=1 Tax=hydrothermal vent metagenome TaxID=652676 RepID=A0A3B0SHT1_9ZZZZ